MEFNKEFKPVNVILTSLLKNYKILYKSFGPNENMNNFANLSAFIAAKNVKFGLFQKAYLNLFI